MSELLHVKAEPGLTAWLLRCVEYPEAMDEADDLSQPFTLRESIASVANIPESSFSLRFTAETDFLTLFAFQPPDSGASFYDGSLRGNRKRYGRRALADWGLAVLSGHAPVRNLHSPTGVRFGICLAGSGHTISIPRAGQENVSSLLRTVSDGPELMKWMREQHTRRPAPRGHRLASLSLAISPLPLRPYWQV